MPIQRKKSKQETRWVTAGSLMFVIVASFFTYFYRYDVPQAPFWDEPYHIASAQKYLHGVFFMEPHPPLAKLFIALGEKMIGGNRVTDTYVTTDYARDIPADFSFRGVRLFPSLFGWLTAPLLFFCFLLLTRSSILSAALSTLYIFDNAEIVHSRGAMLDSTLSFFCVATLLFFLLLMRYGGKNLYRHIALSLCLGIAFGLALSTKVVALVFVLVFIPLVWIFRHSRLALISLVLCSTVGFFVTYIGIWHVHFSLGGKIESSLPDQGYYQASDAYKNILQAKENRSLLHVPVMLRDSLKFVDHYSAGVPRLDLCKAEENGSPSYLWPFGARTISYRWERAGERGTKYLYLVANPASWALGLAGILLSFVLVMSRFLGERKNPLVCSIELLTICAIYAGYMIAISTIDRVMYLYHYFLPLLCSYLLFGIVLANIHQIGRRTIDEGKRIGIGIGLAVIIFALFQYYRPLTYYQPITDVALMRRELLPEWEMVCAGCSRESPLVIPFRGN